MNQIKISGIIYSPIEFEYSYMHENFFRFTIESERNSGESDILICRVPEHLIENFSTGDVVSVVGEIRTRNVTIDGKRHLNVFIFVKELSACEDECDKNEVELTGFIVKKPIHRCTPSGRNITDLMLASQRPYGKSDYIPCIVWGRNADWAEDLPVGKKVMLYGRFQSREYQKVIGDVTKTRTAFEVSGSYIGESEDKANG